MNRPPALPANLPASPDAPLPQRYEAARTAVAECERIDECKTWADKAAALASYARQANDDSLRVMAVRIQARAERRCGELLKQIPRADESTRYGQVGTVPPVTRTQAASNAGLSERQRKTALRIASVPAAEFEAQVEGPTPPTITQLADQGKATRGPDTGAESSDNEADLPAPCLALIAFVRCCNKHDPVSLAREFDIEDAAALRYWIKKARRWLDLFETNLAE
jgi:hypothetical protein